MIRVKTGLVGVALALGLAAVPAAAQDGVGGTWELIVQAPTGATPVTMNVTLDGTKATGTLTSALGVMPVTGSATADSVEVNGVMEVQGMSLPVTVTAKAASGALTGSMKFGDFGEAPLTGKRPAPAAPATAAAAAAAAPATPVSTTGVGGKWNVTLMLQGMGEFPVVADLTQTGEAVTGNFTSAMGTVPVKGTFVGSALKLDFSVDTPQGPLAVTMTGELADQAMAGKATIVGLGEAEWKAVRGQ